MRDRASVQSRSAPTSGSRAASSAAPRSSAMISALRCLIAAGMSAQRRDAAQSQSAAKAASVDAIATIPRVLLSLIPMLGLPQARANRE
jgi:hypothetical protein